MAGVDYIPLFCSVLAFTLPRLCNFMFDQLEVASVTVRFDEISCTIDGAYNFTLPPQVCEIDTMAPMSIDLNVSFEKSPEKISQPTSSPVTKIRSM
jgi:hypothetical protein